MKGITSKTAFIQESKTRAQNVRLSKTRRQRGYHWEDTLVKRFNTLSDWEAFRLGSPSVGLPDILAVSTKNRSLFTIEAKSGTTNTLQVPADQIKRCMRWSRTFELYKRRRVVFAFKFSAKKRIGTGQYESRQLREYFKVWDIDNVVIDCICTYDGDTYGIQDGVKVPMTLKEQKMPF